MCSEECTFNRVVPVPGVGQLVVSLSLCRPLFGPRICCGQSGTGVGFSPNTLVFPCQY